LEFFICNILAKHKELDESMVVDDCHQLIFHLINDKTLRVEFTNTFKDFWVDYGDRPEIMLEQLSGKAPNLKRLFIDISYCQRTGSTSPFSSVTVPFHNLKHLYFSDDWKWSEKDLNLLTRSAPHVTRLKAS
jgi:hypothetical protein